LLEDGKNELPQPFENYVKVMNSAWEFIQENPDQVAILKNEYVTFSENLLNFINKKNEDEGDDKVDINNFFYSDILDKQKEIDFGRNLVDVVMEDLSEPAAVEQNPKAQIKEELKNPEEAKTQAKISSASINPEANSQT